VDRLQQEINKELNERFLNKCKPKEQVGGNHYDTAIQPIEYIEANNLNYHEANVIKYVSRHSRKNGAEDIKKAIWYLERILETKYYE
jgi:hypothetical protein